MKYSLALVAAIAVVQGASAASNATNSTSTAPTDIDILNYALTLEHLEDAFYSGGLAKFDEGTFEGAGLNRTLFAQIGTHEAQHVAFLSGALGSNATQACTYNFPYTTVQEFASLSMVLEGVGVSAYLGAAGYIQNKAYLTAAGSILGTEARHVSWISNANNMEPWSAAYETPLSLDSVYSLAASFITSCPSTNPALPVKAFPALNLTTTNYTAGSNVTLNFTAPNSDSTQFVAFFFGLQQYTVTYDSSSKSVVIPAALSNSTGTVYAAVLSQNATATDDNIIAGPIILSFNSAGNNTIPGPGAGKQVSAKSSGSSVIFGQSLVVGAVPT